MSKVFDWFMLLALTGLIVGIFNVVPSRRSRLFNEFYGDIKIGQKVKIVSGFYEGCEAEFVAWTKDDNGNIAYHIIASCVLKDYPRHVPMKLTPQEAKELKAKGLLE